MYAEGCSISGSDTSGFQKTCEIASEADITVIAVGLDQTQEREGHDCDTISFPGVQSQLLSKVSSIVWVGYPGQSGGQALAEVIFGDYNPAGRLPYTIYPANYVNQVSMFDMGMRPNASNGNPGRTYRFLH